jgi:hypothetical protein
VARVKKGGWEPIPSALIGDTRLSLQTRAVYMLLRNLVWQETRTNEETMTAEIGTVEDIARAAGCSVNSMKRYVAELCDAGWVSVSRSRRGFPFTFTVFSTPTEPKFGSVEGGESEPNSGSVQGQNPALCEPASLLGLDLVNGVEANASTRGAIESFLDEKFGRAPLGTNAGGKRSKAVADLLVLGATADSLAHAWRVADYEERRWAAKTDVALATHFPALTRGYTPPRGPREPRLVPAPLFPGETTEQAYRRWVTEKASDPDFPLFEITITIGEWRDLDDVARDELAALAEQIREPLVSDAIARSLNLKEDAAA